MFSIIDHRLIYNDHVFLFMHFSNLLTISFILISCLPHMLLFVFLTTLQGNRLLWTKKSASKRKNFDGISFSDEISVFLITVVTCKFIYRNSAAVTKKYNIDQFFRKYTIVNDKISAELFLLIKILAFVPFLQYKFF